jgi:hypothetical protein
MKKPRQVLLFLIIITFLTGCRPQSSTIGMTVWLDVPLDGLILEEIQPIKIEGHASSRTEIARIEISINESLWQVVENPPCQHNLCPFTVTWQAEKPGNYTIGVLAVDANGQGSNPDEATIIIGGNEVLDISVTPPPTSTFTPTFVHTPTHTSTPTVTPTPIPQPLIQFWAEPAEVDAGSCTNIRWNVSNVKTVVFGGVEQPLVGNDEECPCVDKTYTLTVTHLDGDVETRSLNVNVNGSCVSSIPPAPTLVVPANGSSLTCRASQSLTWLPVDVPGGITEYQVEIQKSANNSTWVAYLGSPVTGLLDKTTNITVECGWYYRWRVRAVSSGGAGLWSAWSYFAIQLS